MIEYSITHTQKHCDIIRDRTIIEYLPLVKRIVSKMAANLPPYVDVSDLTNAGVIGLIQSIDRFDPTKDNTLATFAAFRIRGAVLGELRSRDVLSRGNRKKVREMKQIWIQLEKKLGREVEEWEVAMEMGLTADELSDLRHMSNISFVSIDNSDPELDDDNDKLLNQLVSDDQDALMLTRMSEIRKALSKSIDTLSEREKMVISLYYEDELTLKEIGAVMNLTESRISQIHSSVLMRLRKKLAKEDAIDR